MSAFFRVRCLEETPSTNIEIKQAIDRGEPEGLVVRSLRQVAGYGRQGHTWESPEGGLYMSVLLRPKVAAAQLPSLSLVAALAVRRAVASLLSEQKRNNVRIKWPNDVVYMDSALDESVRDKNTFSKLCGISLEVHAGGVCVGIGVNVFPPSQALVVEGKNEPVYLFNLSSKQGDSLQNKQAFIEKTAETLLDELEALYRLWCCFGFGCLAEEYQDHAALTYAFVQAVNYAGTLEVEGKVEGIDAEGRLLVRVADGSTVTVASGEVRLV